MAQTEFCFQLIDKFLKDVAPYGHPDSQHKLVGRAINVMLSPLPRNKRAKNPNDKPVDRDFESAPEPDDDDEDHKPAPTPKKVSKPSENSAALPIGLESEEPED